MEFYNLLAESVGFVATGLFLYSSVLTDDKKFSFYYMIGCLFLSSHLFMIDAFVAGASVLLSFLRNFFMKYDRKGEIKITFMFIFTAIFSYYAVTFTNWYELLVPFAAVLMSYGFMYTKGNLLSFILMSCAGLWLVYALQINSLSVIVLELSTICLIFIRMLKQNKAFSRIKNRSRAIS